MEHLEPGQVDSVDRLVRDVLAGGLSRRALLRRAAALGVAAPAVMALVAGRVATARAQTPTPKPGGRLTALIVDDPKYLDIHVTQLAQSRQTMASVYETLTWLDSSDFKIKPRLATEWIFTQPNKLDMTLRDGVKFHQGQPFTADDVKFTIEYVKDPNTGSPNASIVDQIDTVEVLAPNKVRLNLKATWPAIVDDLTTIQIYSKSSTKESIASKPNGTGPFVWTEWVPGDHILLKKNPNYWMAGKPYLDELYFRPVKEYDTRLAMLQSGDADVIFTPDLKDLDAIKANKALAVVPSLLNDSGYILYLNNNRAPMNNQNLRLAVSYALDRSTFFTAFRNGYGAKNTSPWAKQNWPYDPVNDTAFPYDLDKAKQYLAAGGYPNGKKSSGQQLNINLVYPSGYPEWKQGSEMFQAAMSELGVAVKVEELTTADWIDRIVNTDHYDMSWDFHFQRAVDPAWTLSLAFFYPPGPKNICRYKDDQLAQYIQKGGSTLDQNERKSWYFKFQERWNEIQPGLIVGEFVFAHAIRAYVKNFVTQPLQFQDFFDVWLAK